MAVGKKFEAAKKQVEERPYTVPDAMALLKQIHFVKFNETVELHMRLGVDPKHADQMVRGTVVLPHGLGKSKKVCVVASGDKIKEVNAGKVEFRVDKTGIIHAPVGKIEFSQTQLSENAQLLIDTVIKARPAAVKGKYVKRITVASTMSPGIDLDLVVLDAK